MTLGELLFFYEKFSFNVTIEQDSTKCAQVFITLNLKVSDLILVFFDALFIKGENVREKNYKLAVDLQCFFF